MEVIISTICEWGYILGWQGLVTSAALLISIINLYLYISFKREQRQIDATIIKNAILKQLRIIKLIHADDKSGLAEIDRRLTAIFKSQQEKGLSCYSEAESQALIKDFQDSLKLSEVMVSQVALLEQVFSSTKNLSPRLALLEAAKGQVELLGIDAERFSFRSRVEKMKAKVEEYEQCIKKCSVKSGAAECITNQNPAVDDKPRVT